MSPLLKKIVDYVSFFLKIKVESNIEKKGNEQYIYLNNINIVSLKLYRRDPLMM